MSPRVLDAGHCPHCGAELTGRRERICPSCGGSLQVRYLRAGCMSSKPLLLLVAAAAWALVRVAG